MSEANNEIKGIGAKTSSLAGPTVLHVGPSGWGVDVAGLFTDGLIRPPIRRGDAQALLAEFPNQPGRLLVVDGTYFDFPAVGHIELRSLIEAGWSVWGACSMGAARAYEMRDMGMRGFGRAYEEFFKHEDFQDDEIALLHGAEEPFIPLTEPLLHLRGALDLLVSQGRIEPRARDGMISKLKGMWFGDRSLAKTRAMLAQEEGGASIGGAEMEAVVEASRVKKQDLQAFLRQKPWLANASDEARAS